MNSPIDALRLIEIAIGATVFLQTIELLMIRNDFSELGIWRWSLLKKEFPPFLATLLGPLLAERGFLCVLLGRLVTALALILKAHWIFSCFLALSTLLISMRWLGTFNGGSDYMTLLILYSVAIARFSENNPRILKGALLYIAIQTCLSYFVAGLVKIKRSDWRSGRALTGFLISSNYEVPERVKKKASQAGSLTLFQILSWGLILFECTFPLALHDLNTCVLFVSLAALFHLGAFYLFGLNRFFFAWLSAYPALIYWSQSQS